MGHRGKAVASSCSPTYGIGLVGAWIYFIGTAGSFWGGVAGFFKAIVWPGYLVYYALEFLKV